METQILFCDKHVILCKAMPLRLFFPKGSLKSLKALFIVMDGLFFQGLTAQQALSVGALKMKQNRVKASFVPNRLPCVIHSSMGCKLVILNYAPSAQLAIDHSAWISLTMP